MTNRAEIQDKVKTLVMQKLINRVDESEASRIYSVHK